MIIVLQARLRSSRLPAKGFLPFFGQTVWERMCDIALAVRGAKEVVFATGDAPGNDLARPMVEAKGVRFFSGSEDNVLERFCQATRDAEAEYIIRLTCDNYLAQPDVLEGLAQAVREQQADYGYVSPLSHFGGEVVRRALLHACYLSGRYTQEAKEHVTWDIREDTSLRKVIMPDNFMGLDHQRSPTLDTIEDFVRMKSLERLLPALRHPRCLEAAALAARHKLTP